MILLNNCIAAIGQSGYLLVHFFCFLVPATAGIGTGRRQMMLIEMDGEIFTECILLSFAICCNLMLLGGTLRRIPTLFLPWMLFYGFEVLTGWAVSLAFILLPGKR
jgi:hypothetical protein